MLNNELEDLGIDPTNVDAELDALSEMDITGCGLGRRAAALLADEDMTDEERAEAIRELTQQAPKEEPDDGLPDDPLEIEPIGLTPETCEATKADIPETPPLMEADLTDETPDDRANQVLAYIIDWPLSTPDEPDPVPPSDVTRAARKVKAMSARPPKTGTKEYWDKMALILTALDEYIRTHPPSLLRDTWADLLTRIRADIEAALRNPLLTLPPLPSFWPALPPGIPIRAVSHIPTGPPITPQPMPPMVRVRVDAGPSYGSYYRDIPFAALDPTLRSTAIDPLTGVWHDTPTLQAIWQGAPTAPALTTLAPPPTGYESVRQPPTITRETRQITITIAPPPGAPAPRGR